jgi:hypothetical protein
MEDIENIVDTVPKTDRNTAGGTCNSTGDSDRDVDGVTVRELNWFERLLQEWFPYAIIPICLLLAGCGHNTRVFTLGDRLHVGDSQQMIVDLSLSSGVNVVDIARENSGWTIEIDNRTGFKIDSDGTIHGVNRITVYNGPQCTGYFKELTNTNPELAKVYMEAVKAFWQSRITSQGKE